MRDIAHEQIAASTTEELDARRQDILKGMRLYGFSQDILAELHKIESELY